jgi:MerR family transcriptional regulator, light-induced transcriptional regulator
MSVFIEQTADPTEWLSQAARLASEFSEQIQQVPDSSRFRMQPAIVAPGSRRTHLLNRVVVGEILPRLALARQPTRTAASSPAYLTTDVDKQVLVDLLLEREAAAAITFLDQLLSRGATPEHLYLGPLSDAARTLGLMWEQDRCNFVEVTIGLGHLQRAAHALAPRFQLTAVHRAHADSVLLLPARGEQHTFGLLLVAEFFQRAGWYVMGGPMLPATDPAETVRHTWFDILGFSIGSECQLDDLVRDIRRVRRSSRNRNIGILVGGPLLLQRPDLVARIGADATAVDAPGAVAQARRLLTMRVVAD